MTGDKTAADAVRKREAGEAERKNEGLDVIWAHLDGIVLRLTALDRRLSALEAARPTPQEPQPATERRCGTCRWWELEPGKPANWGRRMCVWSRHNMSISASQAILERFTFAENDCTDCPTWEARNV